MNEQNIDDPKKIDIFHTADFSLKLSENATQHYRTGFVNG